MRLKHFAVVTIVLCLPFSRSGELQAELLQVRGKSPAVNQPKSEVNFGSCQRNLLGLDHQGKYGLPSRALSAAEPRVLRILAMKVSFKGENPDDPRTTGNGRFDLRSKEEFKAAEGHTIDPAPHNSAYFLKHLEALAAYWQVVSKGRLRLEYEVFPRDTNSAYEVDSTMAYYGLQSPYLGLPEFFFDALIKVDADSAVHFYNASTGQTNYDVFVVFHPGSDQQNNLPNFGIETPGDLFTGWLRLGQPIAVDSDRVLIRDGLIMPETVSQDGRVTAINAVFAHEFGHQLGLVDLYDTRTFVTMVGDFSLMDDNGFGFNVDLGETFPVLVQGVLPVYPDAWSRAYLGFLDVVEVDPINAPINNIKVAAGEVDTSLNQVILVPINADEYFLIENRRTDIDGDDSTALQADLGETEVILGPRSPDPNKPGNNREYDFLTPGSGMLIWHVDEKVARLDYDGDGVNNFEDNQLQLFYFPVYPEPAWDNHHRFITLVEADGIVDFGGEYFSGYGRQADMFEINGNSSFTPETNPPSSANNNGYSGVAIDDISAALLVMTCDIRTEGRLPNWPNYIGPGGLPLTVYDLNDDGSEEIITAVDNYVLAYELDGSSLFVPASSEVVIIERKLPYGEKSVVHTDTLAVFGRVQTDRSFIYSLAAADLDDDGRGEIVGVTDKNTIVCFTPVNLIFIGEAFRKFEVNASGEIAGAPVILEYDRQVAGLEILYYNSAGQVFVLSSEQGQQIAEIGGNEAPIFRPLTDSQGSFFLFSESSSGKKGAAAADFDRDGVYDLAEVLLDGTLKISYEKNPVSASVGGPVFSNLSVADLDNDGYLDLVFCGDNSLYAYNHDGIISTNFPIPVNRYIPTGPISSSPLLLDINGDNLMEIFVGTANGEVAGFDLKGNRLADYPIAVGGTVVSSPVYARSGSKGGIFTLNVEGEVSATAVSPQGTIGWNTLYGSSLNSGSYARPLGSPRLPSEAIEYLYNYPNPAEQKTTVRFAVREAGKVKLKLYNFAGDLVFDSDLQALAGIDNEYTLDCSAYASGVYFCLLETSASDRKHCTIAIVK